MIPSNIIKFNDKQYSLLSHEMKNWTRLLHKIFIFKITSDFNMLNPIQPIENTFTRLKPVKNTLHVREYTAPHSPLPLGFRGFDFQLPLSPNLTPFFEALNPKAEVAFALSDISFLLLQVTTFLFFFHSYSIPSSIPPLSPPFLFHPHLFFFYYNSKI